MQTREAGRPQPPRISKLCMEPFQQPCEFLVAAQSTWDPCVTLKQGPHVDIGGPGVQSHMTQISLGSPGFYQIFALKFQGVTPK